MPDLTAAQKSRAQELYASLREDGVFKENPRAAELAQSLVKDGVLRDLSGGSQYAAPRPRRVVAAPAPTARMTDSFVGAPDVSMAPAPRSGYTDIGSLVPRVAFDPVSVQANRGKRVAVRPAPRVQRAATPAAKKPVAVSRLDTLATMAATTGKVLTPAEQAEYAALLPKSPTSKPAPRPTVLSRYLKSVVDAVMPKFAAPVQARTSDGVNITGERPAFAPADPAFNFVASMLRPVASAPANFTRGALAPGLKRYNASSQARTPSPNVFANAGAQVKPIFSDIPGNVMSGLRSVVNDTGAAKVGSQVPQLAPNTLGGGLLNAATEAGSDPLNFLFAPRNLALTTPELVAKFAAGRGAVKAAQAEGRVAEASEVAQAAAQAIREARAARAAAQAAARPSVAQSAMAGVVNGAKALRRRIAPTTIEKYNIVTDTATPRVPRSRPVATPQAETVSPPTANVPTAPRANVPVRAIEPPTPPVTTPPIAPIAPVEPVTEPKAPVAAPARVVKGAKGTAYTPVDNEAVPFEYRVVEASDLRPSHDPQTLTKTQGYDQALQPRDLSEPAEATKLNVIAKRLQADRLGAGGTTGEGAPFVGEDMQVESGNGRSIGILRNYKGGTAQAAAYRAYVRDNAAQFGYKPEDVDAFTEPILVRVRAGNGANDVYADPAKRADLARRMGAEITGRKSASSMARTDADMLVSSFALKNLVPMADGSITGAGNQEFRNKFFGSLPETELASLLDGKTLSTAGKERIERALMTVAYGDADLTSRVFAVENDGAKNVGEGLRVSAGLYAKAKADMKEGLLAEADISEDLAQAVSRFTSLVQSKLKGTSTKSAVLSDLSMGDGLLGAEDANTFALSPEGRLILQFLGERSGTKSAVSRLLQSYVTALHAVGDPTRIDAGTMKRVVVPTKGELLKQALTRTAGELAKDDTADLFASPVASTPSPAQAVADGQKSVAVANGARAGVTQQVLPGDRVMYKGRLARIVGVSTGVKKDAQGNFVDSVDLSIITNPQDVSVPRPGAILSRSEFESTVGVQIPDAVYDTHRRIAQDTASLSKRDQELYDQVIALKNAMDKASREAATGKRQVTPATRVKLDRAKVAAKRAFDVGVVPLNEERSEVLQKIAAIKAQAVRRPAETLDDLDTKAVYLMLSDTPRSLTEIQARSSEIGGSEVRIALDRLEAGGLLRKNADGTMVRIPYVETLTKPQVAPKPAAPVAKSAPVADVPPSAVQSADVKPDATLTPTWSIAPARYAQGKIIVRAPSADNFKSPAALVAEKLGGNWTNREQGYTLPASKEKAFRDAMADDAAERLRRSAEALETKAQEAQGKDRTTNTPKRGRGRVAQDFAVGEAPPNWAVGDAAARAELATPLTLDEAAAYKEYKIQGLRDSRAAFLKREELNAAAGGRWGRREVGESIAASEKRTGNVARSGKNPVPRKPRAPVARKPRAVQNASATPQARRATTATGRVAVAEIPQGANAPTVKPMRELVRDLSRAIGRRVTAIKGKPGTAAGVFYPDFGSVTARLGNVDIATHEIAHALVQKHGLLDGVAGVLQGHALDGELLDVAQYGSKPPSGVTGQAALDYERGEGFAEFIRAHVMNPAEAAARYPLLQAEYDAAMSSGVAKADAEAIATFSDGLRQTKGLVSTEKMRRGIRFSSDVVKERSPVRRVIALLTGKKTGAAYADGQFATSQVDKIRKNFTDKVAPFISAVRVGRERTGKTAEFSILPQNDPVLLARKFAYVDSKFERFLTHGITLDDGTKLTGAFADILAPLDSSSVEALNREAADLKVLLLSRRVSNLADRNLAKVATGEMTQAQADAANAGLTGVGYGMEPADEVARDAKVLMDALQQSNPAYYDRLTRGADAYYKQADGVLGYMVAQGRMSQADVDTIRANNAQYASLQRVFDETPVDNIGAQGYEAGGGALGKSKTPIQAVKGALRDAKDPVASLMAQMYAVTKESDRNAVMRAFVDVFDGSKNGQPGVYTGDIVTPAQKGQPGAFRVFRDGVEEYYTVGDKTLLETMNGLGKVVSPSLAKPLVFMARVLHGSIVRTPGFMVRNKLRDLGDRFFNSRTQAIASGNAVQELKDNFIPATPAEKELAAIMGLSGNGSEYLNNARDFDVAQNKVMDALVDAQRSGLHPLKWTRKIIGGYNAVTEATETSTRFAEYRAAYRHARTQGLDETNANLWAISQGRETTNDFAVSGDYAQFVNQYIPFTSASVGGARTFFNRAATESREKPGRLAAKLAVVAAASVGTLMLANSHGEDERTEYLNFPDYLRDMFYLVKVGDNMWLSIPKAHESGLIGSGVERLVDRAMGNDKAFDGYAGSVAKTMLPVDESLFMGGAGGKPIVELMANKDFYRDRYIVPPEEEGTELKNRRTDSASNLGKSVQSFSSLLLPKVPSAAGKNLVPTGIDARKADFVIGATMGDFGRAAMIASDLGRTDKVRVGNRAVKLGTGILRESPGTEAKSVQKALTNAKRVGAKLLAANDKKNVPFSRAFYDALFAGSDAEADVKKRKLRDLMGGKRAGRVIENAEIRKNRTEEIVDRQKAEWERGKVPPDVRRRREAAIRRAIGQAGR